MIKQQGSKLVISDTVSAEQLLDAYTTTGDEAYFNELYARYHQEIYDLVLHKTLGGDDGLAQDAVQLTFMGVKKYHKRFDTELKFGPWLRTIAISRAIDVKRRHQKTRKVATFNFSDATGAGGNSVTGGYKHSDPISPDPADSLMLTSEQEVEKKELYAQLSTVIDSLPERYRELIRAHYYDGLSGEEVAERFNLPIGTVWIYLHRARKIMRSRLERRDISAA